MRMPRNAKRFATFAGIALAATSIGACTSTDITPERVYAPPERYRTVAVGEITGENELWADKAQYVRAGLIERLEESGAFDQVLYPAPDPLPPEAIAVTGHITEVDKGDRWMRFLVGFGAGEATAEGDFSLVDANGMALARFETEKRYDGGTGLGGFDFYDMDDLMWKLGEDTADWVAEWAAGEAPATRAAYDRPVTTVEDTPLLPKEGVGSRSSLPTEPPPYD